MDIFSKRPLFISCMLFLACSVAGYFIEGSIKTIIVIITAIALVFSIILAAFRYHSSEKKNAFLLLILSLFMVTLSLSSSLNYYDRSYEKYSTLYGTQNTVIANVTEVKYEKNFASKYEIRVKSVNGQSDEYKAYLECEYSGALRVGDLIVVSATANELPQNDSGKFSERAEALQDAIFAIFSSDSESQLSIVEYTDDSGIEIAMKNINGYLSGILTENIGGEEGNLSSALLLGNKHLLSSQSERDFRRVGASHVLALSGMHMSIIMGFAMFILRPFFKKRSVLIAILSLFAVFYLILTGFSVSATRSVIMLLMVYIAFLVSGVSDSLTALSFAGFLIVLFSPGAILDAGFWLSFSATLGILVFVSALNDVFQEKLDKCEDKRELMIRKLIYSIILSIVACFAALIPIIIVMCIFIKELSILSVLSSLVMSIPTAMVIVLSLLLLPLHAVPYISDAIVWCIRSAAGAMLGYSSELSDLENIVYSLNYPFATLMAVILGAALLYCFASKHKKRILSLLPFAVCLLVFIGVMFAYEGINDGNLNVSYINSSSKSDMIVLSDEREVVICDLSNGSKTAYSSALEEAFEARATEIKAILLTRYTNSHIATFYSIFAENKVRAIWAPYPRNGDEQDMLDRLYTVANQNGVEVYVYKSGEVLGPFKDVRMVHSSAYVERSVVPIDLLAVYTAEECLTYLSPAYNESELFGMAEYYISRSKHVIFGGRGPKVKQGYGIGEAVKLKAVTFAEKELVGYFEKPESPFISYYLVEKEEKMEFYLDE